MGSGWVSTSCSSAAASHTTRPISWQTATCTWTTTCKQTWRMRSAVAWHDEAVQLSKINGFRGARRGEAVVMHPPPQSDAAEPPQPPPSPAPTSSRSHAGDRALVAGLQLRNPRSVCLRLLLQGFVELCAREGHEGQRRHCHGGGHRDGGSTSAGTPPARSACPPDKVRRVCRAQLCTRPGSLQRNRTWVWLWLAHASK